MKEELNSAVPLKVRSRHHDFDQPIPKHYDSGNAVLTAEFNAFQLIIPTGECFFIRSVQRLAFRAEDPELRLQVKAFIGQEAMHYKETNRALDILERDGFPVKAFQGWFDGSIRFFERWMGPKLSLAATAGAEHFTAIFSIWELGTRYTDRMPAPIRDLNYWHAAEELEHRAVAFDLLQKVAPRNYPLRALGFILGIAAIWIGYAKAIRMIMKWEGLGGAAQREETHKARRIRMPIFHLGFPKLFTYLRPGFHPRDLDDNGLGQAVLAEQDARRNA